MVDVRRDRREEKRRREDQALNRVLLWFGGAVLLEFLLLLLNRFYINYDPNGLNLARGLAVFLKGLMWVSLAGLAASAVWLAAAWRRGGRRFAPTLCLAVCLALFLCAFISRVWTAVGVQFLYLAVPTVAVLALIYYLYQREFFIVAAQGALTLMCLWAYRRLMASHTWVVYGLFAAAFLLTVGTLVFAALLRRRDGMWGKRRVLGKDAGYLPLFLSSAVSLCALAAGPALGLTVAYAAIFVVMAWLFIAAVYYTVRLM